MSKLTLFDNEITAIISLSARFETEFSNYVYHPSSYNGDSKEYILAFFRARREGKIQFIRDNFDEFVVYLDKRAKATAAEYLFSKDKTEALKRLDDEMKSKYVYSGELAKAVEYYNSTMFAQWWEECKMTGINVNIDDFAATFSLSFKNLYKIKSN